jgi:hypothetical protein
LTAVFTTGLATALAVEIAAAAVSRGLDNTLHGWWGIAGLGNEDAAEVAGVTVGM